LQIDHLGALGAQRVRQPVVLRLHLGQRRDGLALPVPAGLQIAEGADFLDALCRVDHVEFVARPVHQNSADLPDVVVAAPASAP
jgi:hypothetical protein